MKTIARYVDISIMIHDIDNYILKMKDQTIKEYILPKCVSFIHVETNKIWSINRSILGNIDSESAEIFLVIRYEKFNNKYFTLNKLKELAKYTIITKEFIAEFADVIDFNEVLYKDTSQEIKDYCRMFL
jgi:hypothetical protein